MKVLAIVTFAVILIARSSSGAVLSPEKRVKIEAAVSRFMTVNRTPGVSVAIVGDGELEWSAGFGFADLENGVPASSTTLYRLASLSKPLTAIGAMILWENGQLNLDAPVQQYCPDFPPKEGLITVRRLLGHLGGIRHYRSEGPEDPEFANMRNFDDPIQGGLSFFAADPLVGKPGANYHYTTQGFTVIGCAMEGASGQFFVDLMKSSVFVPAGMDHTQADDRIKMIPERARFYSRDAGGGVRAANALDASYKIPGGGLIASAVDMGHFMSAMLKDQLVKRETRDLMWASQKTDNGVETGYGYGWRVMRGAGFTAAGHSGGQPGTATALHIVPSRGFGVVVLANMDGADSKALAERLTSIVLGGRIAP